MTAAVLGPVVFSILWWGGEAGFGILLAAGSAVCLYEYYSMGFARYPVAQALGILSGMLPVLSVLLEPRPWTVVPGLFVALFFSALFFVVTFDKWGNALSMWSTFLLGAGYIGFCASHLGLIRALPLGRQWVIFLFIVIFSGDAGAYYVGRSLGRRKLCPKVSKGKTTAGAWGGLLASAVAAFCGWFLLLRPYPPISLMALALVLGTVGQVGDLAESVVKRGLGFKDSGKLLPGHGGVFDRVDAVLMAAPVLFWALELGVIRVY